MSDDRKIWSHMGSDFIGDGEITVITHADGVMIAVEQDQAVDSYNSAFNCQCLIPRGKLGELIAVLQSALTST